MDAAEQTALGHTPVRTCLGTGQVRAKEGMVRFVLSPDGLLTPDVAESFPGRGVWVTATRDALQEAVRKKAFARGFKQPVKASLELVDQVERLLRVRALHWLALANKSGAAVMGFAKVEVALKNGRPALLLLAADAGAADAEKIQSLADWKEVPICRYFSREELAKPFGRESIVHVAIQSGGIVQQMQKEIRRLAGFCYHLAL